MYVECRARQVVFFFNDTATTEIYTLSLHDALPISARRDRRATGQLQRADVLQHGAAAGEADAAAPARRARRLLLDDPARLDRKSTRLNSSHANISYAVFCLKKKTLTYTARSSTSE